MTSFPSGLRRNLKLGVAQSAGKTHDGRIKCNQQISGARPQKNDKLGDHFKIWESQTDDWTWMKYSRVLENGLMGQWKIVSLEEWPSDVACPIPIDAFSTSAKPKAGCSDQGDWVLIVESGQLDATEDTLFDDSELGGLSFHRIGFVCPADQKKAMSVPILESLFKHCDLVALPELTSFDDSRAMGCGTLTRSLSSKGKKPSGGIEKFQLVQTRSANADQLTRGAPINRMDEEDLDAREKWFKNRR